MNKTGTTSIARRRRLSLEEHIANLGQGGCALLLMTTEKDECGRMIPKHFLVGTAPELIETVGQLEVVIKEVEFLCRC